MNLAVDVIAPLAAAAGGAMLYRAFAIARDRRRQRQLVVRTDAQRYHDLTVSGCACQLCKNVFWAQRTEVELPKCCPYCCRQFEGRRLVDSATFDQFIVGD